MLDLSPPHDEDAEAAVLGAIMLANTWLKVPEVFDLTADDFYRPRHQLIWRSIKSLNKTGDPIDAITVTSRLGQVGEQFEGAKDYCETLVTRVVALGNTKAYAQIVKDQSMLRSLLSAGQQIERSVYERQGEPSELIERGLNLVGSVGVSEREKCYGPDELMDLAVDHLSNERPAETFPLPLADLNEACNGGLRRGQVMAIAGWPNDGKSSFAMDCLESAIAGTDKKAKIYLTEMTVQEINHRIIARQSPLTLNEVIRGDLTIEQHRSLANLKMPNITIQPAAGWTVDQICNDILRTKPDIVLVDHFHRINFGTRHKIDAMDEASAKLNNVAKDNQANCALLLVAHLSRPGTEREEAPPKPTGRHLRGTQMLEADADIVCFVYRRRDEMNQKRLPETDVYFIRNRGGDSEASAEAYFNWKDLRFGETVKL